MATYAPPLPANVADQQLVKYDTSRILTQQDLMHNAPGNQGLSSFSTGDFSAISGMITSGVVDNGEGIMASYPYLKKAVGTWETVMKGAQSPTDPRYLEYVQIARRLRVTYGNGLRGLENYIQAVSDASETLGELQELAVPDALPKNLAGRGLTFA